MANDKRFLDKDSRLSCEIARDCEIVKIDKMESSASRISECGMGEWLVPVCLASRGNKQTNKQNQHKPMDWIILQLRLQFRSFSFSSSFSSYFSLRCFDATLSVLLVIID